MDVVEMRRGRARVWIANVFVGHLLLNKPLNSVVDVAPTSASLPSVGVVPLHDDAIMVHCVHTGDVVHLVGRRVIGECEKKRKGRWGVGVGDRRKGKEELPGDTPP